MNAFTLYGDRRSGNCLKVLWSANFLGITCNWVETDIVQGRSRTPEFLAINSFGQVPTAVFGEGDDRFVLTQSNAIVLYLGEQAPHPHFLPADPQTRAQVYQWLFWEQNSHEPYIAGRRYRSAMLGHSDDQIDSEWLPRGNAALAQMNGALEKSDFLVGNQLSAADIVLVAYSRVAHEGGFDLDDYRAVQAWIGRVEKVLGIDPVTEQI